MSNHTQADQLKPHLTVESAGLGKMPAWRARFKVSTSKTKVTQEKRQSESLTTVGVRKNIDLKSNVEQNANV